jgi:hypothetical protein
MYAGRVSQGSLAASAAVLCVLSLVPPAMAAADAFSGLLLDRPRCCPPALAPADIAHGVAGPAAGMTAGGRVTGAGAASPRQLPAPGVGAARGFAVPRPDRPGPEAGDTLLAQQTPAPPDKTSDDVQEKRPPATQMPPAGDSITADSLSAGADAFRGSTKPAGPDLTIGEERDVISRGWQ